MICALCAQQVGISCAEMLMHSVVGTADMGKSQGVRALRHADVRRIFADHDRLHPGADPAAAFVGRSRSSAVAVVISAGCMIALTREGF